MSFDNTSLRNSMRESIAALVAAGPGWDAYTIDRAETAVREFPMFYGGIVHETEELMGAERVARANDARKWFNGKGKG